jgi:hypothetical protein
LKRTLTDVLRRGILSTLANWPVILTRVAESLVLFGAVVVSIIGCIVPLLVSAGIGAWELPATSQNAWEMMARIFAQHAALFAYLFLFILVMGLVMVVIHAFVSAGAVRIFVDADRAVPDTPEPRREQFAAFTLERWSEGARAAWLRLFWIYNGTWGVYGLLLLVPTLLFALLISVAVSAENTAAVIAATCGGVALLVGIAVLLAFVIAIWTQKAVVICVARDLSAAAALRIGWAETRADFLRLFLVYFLIAVVTAGVGSVLSSAFAPFTFGARVNNLWAILTGPVQIASFALQMAVGNAIASWLIACFAAMTEER